MDIYSRSNPAPFSYGGMLPLSYFVVTTIQMWSFADTSIYIKIDFSYMHSIEII